MGVSPFRDLRLNGYLRLPAAYRSLSRLSSALSAKASTLRSCSLNLNKDDSLFRLRRSVASGTRLCNQLLFIYNV